MALHAEVIVFGNGLALLMEGKREGQLEGKKPP